MSHAPILPVLLPLVAAVLQLWAGPRRLGLQRALGLASMASMVPLAGWLLKLAADGPHLVYALGGWSPPFGIVLVLDRLSALMVALATALALCCLLFATSGGGDGDAGERGAHAEHGDDGEDGDRAGRHFHPLFQLQIAALNGAFLAGDLFNLFVFFEVLLLASYVLLAHGGGLARTRAGVAYVVLNLIGSLVFLVALGLVYGALGTLNLADVAFRLAESQSLHPGLARAAAVLLIVVFALKAALVPLGFWLPGAYAAASAPVAALFAIMTKVGVYAIVRVNAVALAPAAVTADVLDGWLAGLALATIVVAALGALAATRLKPVVAYLMMLSAGTLLAAVGPASATATAAILYYLIHSTLVGAVLFLLADLIARARGAAGDRLVSAGPAAHAVVLGIAFFVAAVAIVGLPPLSGFLGKLMVLQAVEGAPHGPATWIVVLGSSFLVLINLARIGGQLFWETRDEPVSASARAIAPGRAVAAALLLLASPLLSAFAGPVAGYARAAAEQLHAPGAYVTGVLGGSGAARDIPRTRVPR